MRDSYGRPTHDQNGNPVYYDIGGNPLPSQKSQQKGVISGGLQPAPVDVSGISSPAEQEDLKYRGKFCFGFDSYICDQYRKGVMKNKVAEWFGVQDAFAKACYSFTNTFCLFTAVILFAIFVGIPLMALEKGE